MPSALLDIFLWGAPLFLVSQAVRLWVFRTHPRVRNFLRRYLSLPPIQHLVFELPWLRIVPLILLMSTAEEIIFRAWLQPLLGLVPTSILFGLAHRISWEVMLITGLLGLYLGWIYQETGSLLVVSAIHGIYNLLTLWALRSCLSQRTLS